jgi:hypothetical protein
LKAAAAIRRRAAFFFSARRLIYVDGLAMINDMTSERTQLPRNLYDAFNKRGFEKMLSMMRPTESAAIAQTASIRKIALNMFLSMFFPLPSSKEFSWRGALRGACVRLTARGKLLNVRTQEK